LVVDVPAEATIGTDAAPPWTGKCAGMPALCDDGNPCSDDGCEPLVGCFYTKRSCDDGDGCTLDGCNVETGSCTHSPEPCDDDNACTKGTCEDGKGCVYSLVSCDDADPCTADGCDPKKGCVHAKLTCDDGQQCTTDWCDPTSGCKHDKPAGASCCALTADCDDQNPCTTDTCQAGICGWTAIWGCCLGPSECDDVNACTTDVCDPIAHQCMHAPKQGNGCCVANAECDDGQACTADLCVEFACGHLVVCCSDDKGCDDGSSCTKDTCTTSGCAWTAKAGDSCCKADVASTNFEASDKAWSFALTPSVSSSFGVSALADAASGKQSLVLSPGVGKPEAPTSTATVSFAEVALPAGTKVGLAFKYRNTMPVGAGTPKVVLRVETPTGVRLVWAGADAATWKTVNVDLTGFAARVGTRTVALRLEAIGGGSVFGTAAFDAFTITSSCTAPNCSTPLDCDDGLGATSETCVSGICVFSENPAYCEQIPGIPSANPCNDTDPCTMDLCLGFACTHTPIAGCCKSATDCDDGNPCTTDSCTANTCKHKAAPPEQCCGSVVDCDDANPCTEDSCPVAGLPCAHTKTDASCCIATSDCDDGDACTTDACANNVCAHTNNCCKVDAECADGETTCTKDVCVEGFCKHEATGAAGCCEPAMVSEDFEDGTIEPMTLASSSSAVKWQIFDKGKAKSGKWALYYGNPVTMNFDDGVATTGTVALPAQAIPEHEKTLLTFALYMDTENSTYYDKFEVRVVTDSKTLTVWTKDAEGFSTLEWGTWTVDLSAFGGKTVTIQFVFDTGDNIANSTEGVYLDDVNLLRACSTFACNIATDCDDKLATTSESCAAGQCKFTW